MELPIGHGVRLEPLAAWNLVAVKHQHRQTGFPCSFLIVADGPVISTDWLRCPERTCRLVGKIERNAWIPEGRLNTVLDPRDRSLKTVFPRVVHA